MLIQSKFNLVKVVPLNMVYCRNFVETLLTVDFKYLFVLIISKFFFHEIKNLSKDHFRVSLVSLSSAENAFDLLFMSLCRSMS